MMDIYSAVKWVGKYPPHTLFYYITHKLKILYLTLYRNSTEYQTSEKFSA